MVKNKTQKFNRHQLTLITISVIVGIIFGLLSCKNMPTATGASGAELEKARKDISKQYLAESSTKCSGKDDPTKPTDRVEVFYKYLRVNKFGNRAVIRGCYDFDNLLYKNKSGEWVKTTVNMSLDTRVNPKWQKECLIEDITVADDVVRPENDSIDLLNFQECNDFKNL